MWDDITTASRTVVMIKALKNLFKSVAIWLRWPQIQQKTLLRPEPGDTGDFEISVGGRLKIAIEHAGPTVVQRLPIDAGESLQVTVHNIVADEHRNDGQPGATVRLILTNPWSALMLKARRVLRLHQSRPIDLPQPRVRLQPLPTTLVEPKSPRLPLHALSRSHRFSLASLQRAPMNASRIDVGKVNIKPIDVLAGIAASGQPTTGSRLGQVSAWASDFQTTLHAPGHRPLALSKKNPAP